MGGGLALTATSTAAVARPNTAPPSPVAINLRNHISFHPHNEEEEDSSFATLFLSIPSPSEVQLAISSLRSFMQDVSLCGTELSWLQPLLSQYGPRFIQSPGFRRVKDALLLLETNQSIQRLVLSISSDKSVWGAVLKNKMIKQLSKSLGPGYVATLEGSRGSNKERDAFASILRWILDMVKVKVVELVDKFRSLVDETFDSAPQKDSMTAETKERLEEKLKSSVLLSIIILLIVVVTRVSHPP